jgi:hypothetical protein
MEKDIVYYYEFPIQSTIDKTQNKQNKNKTTQKAQRLATRDKTTNPRLYNTWQNHETGAILIPVKTQLTNVHHTLLWLENTS